MEFTAKQLAAIQSGLEGFISFVEYLESQNIEHGYTEDCINTIREVLASFPDDEE